MTDYAHVAIEYDEFHPETFRGVTIQLPTGESMRVMGGGSPAAHLGAALDIAADYGLPVMFSSTVDNFISDLPKISELREDLAKLRPMPE